MNIKTWKQQKSAAYSNGRFCFENNQPCTTRQYMNNQELADQWAAGWEAAQADQWIVA